MLARLFRIALASSFLITSASAQAGRAYGGGPSWWNAGWGGVLPWEESYENADGLLSVRNRTGAIQTKDHPFFEPLGSNGRACVTCHQPAGAMSVSVAMLRDRWRESAGLDPVFAAVDGSNCPNLPQAERGSHSLLLDRGLFRIALPWPPKDVPKPEFKLEIVSDPAGCNRTPGEVSVYRRPRMTANLDSVLRGASGTSVLMADGREPSLESQATNAALTHEQSSSSSAPSADVLKRIVEFETQIFAAQGADIRGGLTDERGSPQLGPNPLERGAIRGLSQISFEPWRGEESGVQTAFRASAARGSDLFFGRNFRIDGVPQFGSVEGTCGTCHASGTTRWMNIGTTTHSSEFESQLPVFRVTCGDRVLYTEDPGRGLISGKCADVGAIVLQQFRGLAARVPYFSNGSAAGLRDVVDFYDRRFHIGYSEREKLDLVNFLRVL